MRIYLRPLGPSVHSSLRKVLGHIAGFPRPNARPGLRSLHHAPRKRGRLKSISQFCHSEDGFGLRRFLRFFLIVLKTKTGRPFFSWNSYLPAPLSPGDASILHSFRPSNHPLRAIVLSLSIRVAETLSRPAERLLVRTSLWACLDKSVSPRPSKRKALTAATKIESRFVKVFLIMRISKRQDASWMNFQQVQLKKIFSFDSAAQPCLAINRPSHSTVTFHLQQT